MVYCAVRLADIFVCVCPYRINEEDKREAYTVILLLVSEHLSPPPLDLNLRSVSLVSAKHRLPI